MVWLYAAKLDEHSLAPHILNLSVVVKKAGNNRLRNERRADRAGQHQIA
jgi:hypothetical protein